MAETTKTKQSTGTIQQIVGVVVVVEFEAGKLPEIYDAISVQTDKGELLLEVEQHISSNVVRSVALGATEGLTRGQEVKSTGAPISVPIGDDTQGRMFNVIGKPIDGKPDNFKKRMPIHNTPPTLAEQSTSAEIFETGIKVIDLIAPMTKGGKVGLFGGAGVGKTVLITGIPRARSAHRRRKRPPP